MMGSHALFYLVVVCSINTLNGQRGIPIFDDYSAIQNRYLPENIPIGFVMGHVVAHDPDGTPLDYYIEGGGGEYFDIDQNNGTVTLKKLLDFEKETEVRITVRVVDEDTESNTIQTKIFVNDVNDNQPRFEDEAISTFFPESNPIGFQVAHIVVNDTDTSNALIEVECYGTTDRFRDACQKFRLVQTAQSNKFWIGDVILNERLDYEERNSYAIQLRAFDGEFYVIVEVHVELGDVNDSPPRWVTAGPAIIPEEEPVNTTVQTVVAEDSDSSRKNPIRYELIGESANTFQIDPETGVISNRIQIDFDAVDYPKGVPYDVVIKARELLNGTSGDLGDDPLTTATITIKVTVQDINDNSPTFDQRQYEAYVPENIASNANVPGLQMTITDIDSGTFNSFDLVTLAHNDVFRIIPNDDAASSSATLYVTDGSFIDFEAGPRTYIIPVEARENAVLPAFTGSATVTIYVTDVNDITPTFDALSYDVEISELSPENTLVIDLNATDPEADEYGTAGIRYTLYGNIPEHFWIDERTGVIRVAACDPPGTPGESPCIDFERKRQYPMTVSATDDNGGDDGRTRSVNVNVRILDENDNIPRPEEFYLRYIREEETVTINPLRIDAADPDTVGGPLTFSIEGDSTGIWQVTTQLDPVTGELYGNITARRPVFFTDAPNRDTGAFEFGIVVRDQLRSVTRPVTIIVIDINNNAPEFQPNTYIESIPETTLGNVFITRITASDADTPTTDNGVIDFSISSGALGKFLPTNVTRQGNDFVADIYTTAGATFNFETQNLYEMTLVARDRGTPESKSGTATLIVRIEDTNNRAPRIYPSFQSINVMENEPIGRSVYQVSANDPDATNDLRYFMVAASATDGTGNVVNNDTYNFSNLFRIDEMTGDVLVNAPLDRDRAARITHNLTVFDVFPNVPQRGEGVLLIHILEFNDQAPQFNRTYYELQIPEELNINSFVQNFNCLDEDDQIAGYILTQDVPRRPDYFAFLPGSGAMIVNERIDFEAIESIELTARCLDSGIPQLSNSTRIYVRIININDNTPTFGERRYRAQLPEGATGGTLNINVQATDLDKGDYGVVRYDLDDPRGWFEIDEITGRITVLAGARFDREESESIGFQVIAYDSPLDASVRRRSSVPVYIEITDINDNCPEFSRESYSGTVPESANRNTDIIDIIATDADEGPNAEIVFSVQSGSGDPPEAETLFSVGELNGRVMVIGDLKGKAGFYRFNVTATDMRGTNAVNQCSTTVPVVVEVQESLNDAPEWIRPPNRDFVIRVLESQYEGMLVYNAKAVDPNRGPNGVVDYFFTINGNELVPNTPEFRINRVTGVIRAEVVFDREERDSYFLTLMARDRGNPAASSETTLTVVILDVDDNDPVFPMRNGAVVPLEIDIDENRNYPNDPIGYCNATDADSDHANNRIYYRILAAQDNVRNYVSVDDTTCEIRLLDSVRYDEFPTLEFDILAYNEKNDDTVRRYKREVNPSVQHVVIRVRDTNNNAPEFLLTPYFGCVSVEAPYRQTILEVSARDMDAGSRITYSLEDPTSSFGISSTLGTIYNRVSFSSASRTDYSLNVIASDGELQTSEVATIFVTSPSNIVRLKINRPLTDVEPFSRQLVRTIVNSTGDIVHACIDDMRNHLDGDGRESLLATDVFITAIRRDTNNQNPNSNYMIYPADDLVGVLNGQMARDDSPYTAISVTEVEVKGDDDDWTLEEDAVLAILIICILLIFLALLLCCIGCYCIRNSRRRKMKKIRAKQHTIVQVAQEPVETSFNPVYHNAGDDYATVQKARPMVSPIAPVVIPAPQNLEPVLNEEPPSYLSPFEEPQVYRPEEPEPVIETEVMPDPEPIRDPEPYRPFEPEYEDKIETEVIDDVPADMEPPPPPHVDIVQMDPDENIDVEIRDSPPITPPDSPREGPSVVIVQSDD